MNGDKTEVLRASPTRSEQRRMLMQRGSSEANSKTTSGKERKFQRSVPSLPKFKCLEDDDANGG